MQSYELELSSPVATSFRCTKAANSLDIDQKKKSIHRFKVEADLETPFNIGLVVGASGAGKTTLAKHIWGDDCFFVALDLAKPVIDQFPEEYEYDNCAAMLCGVGLTSVPCWIRPAYTLSNGQRARAECALQMSRNYKVILIDEWTSVVDRTVAKVMSHCIQKHARKTNKKIVILSCHYDVIEWLNPDWVIDCNKQEYTDRRLLWQSSKRTEHIQFDIREVDRKSWKYFSKYHYLSDQLPGGIIRTFGLFHGLNQVGFQCFANYTPHKNKFEKMKMHSNRVVIHPDYVGFSLGIKMVNETSKIMKEEGFDVWAKFSSVPMYLSTIKSKSWQLVKIDRKTKRQKGQGMDRNTGFRKDVKAYSFRYVG